MPLLAASPSRHRSLAGGLPGTSPVPPSRVTQVLLPALVVLRHPPTTRRAYPDISLVAYSPGSPRSLAGAPAEPSLGHVLGFRSVPPAHTLVRRVGKKCLRLHSAGSTLPLLWPTGSSLGSPPRLRPGTSPHALQIRPHDRHPALQVAFRLTSLPLGSSPWLSPPFPAPCPLRVLLRPELPGPRGITPAFGYGPPYLRSRGT